MSSKTALDELDVGHGDGLEVVVCEEGLHIFFKDQIF